MGKIIVKFPENTTRQRGVRAMRSAAPSHDDIAQTQFFYERDLQESERKNAEQSDQMMVVEDMQLQAIHPLDAEDESEQKIDSPAGMSWGIEAMKAHTSQYDGRGVSVAVLDSGIDLAHPAFKDIKDKIEYKNETDADDDYDIDHGTHCAGTIFGQDVDGTRIGIARNIEKAYISKVLPARTGSLLAGLDWAFENNANIAAMSLGFDFPGYVQEQVDYGIDVRAATSKALIAYHSNLVIMNLKLEYFAAREQRGETGMLVIAASGNESRRPKFTIAASPPASSPDIISVGAVGKGPDGFRLAKFSNSKPTFVAPGVQIMSAKANSQGLVATSGTSMACPHVAGLAALYWQKAKDNFGMAKVSMVESSLMGNTQILEKGLEETGYGIPMAPQ